MVISYMWLTAIAADEDRPMAKRNAAIAKQVLALENPDAQIALINRHKQAKALGQLAIIWTTKSSNTKTGPIPVSTTSSETCPSVCPFRGAGCYAESGPLAFLWRGLDNAGPNASWRSGVATVTSTDWNGLCKNVAALPEGQLWRHNQAGDLPHTNGMISDTLLEKLVNANRGKRGFTYTHHEAIHTKHNRALIQWANANGFTVNLSGNNLKHADQLAKLGVGPVVAVLPSTVSGPEKIQTPAGRTVRVCPATYSDRVSCKTCQWCAIAERDWIVGFPAHGAKKSTIDRLTKA